ncbi:hypothetical protein F5146DRAFT_1073464 [Armillaria mellea]|nr:hypothetical protein F5146DRAFT_1073464 [Armillaria mellea]
MYRSHTLEKAVSPFITIFACSAGLAWTSSLSLCQMLSMLLSSWKVELFFTRSPYKILTVLKPNLAYHVVWACSDSLEQGERGPELEPHLFQVFDTRIKYE